MKKLLTLATMTVLLMILMGCDGTGPTTEPHRPLETPVTQTPTPTAGPTPTARPTPRVEVVPGLAPDSFVVVVPRTLRTGYTERVSVSLFNGDRPVSGKVRLTLLDDGASVRTVAAKVEGAANIELPVPQLERGKYEIEVEVEDVSETRSASVEVEDGVLLFVETDKPIYKPGQTVHMRLMTLDALLKPWPSAATIEVQDAKGIKVFKKEVATDDYGMVTVDLPLSTDPNLGVWKLTALAGDQKTQLDVRVEEYVLPKYEVNIDTEKDWVLADEPIKGTVSGEYSFGKPVVGEVEIIATKYVGEWEEYARFNGQIDGDITFEFFPGGICRWSPCRWRPGKRHPRRDYPREGNRVRREDQQASDRSGHTGDAEGYTREPGVQARPGDGISGGSPNARRDSHRHRSETHFSLSGQGF